MTLAGNPDGSTSVVGTGEVVVVTTRAGDVVVRTTRVRVVAEEAANADDVGKPINGMAAMTKVVALVRERVRCNVDIIQAFEGSSEIHLLACSLRPMRAIRTSPVS